MVLIARILRHLNLVSASRVWFLLVGSFQCDAATCLMVTAFCHVKTKIDKLFNKGPDSKYMGASLMAQMVKTVPPMLGLTPGLGRPPGEGNGNPLQYPCLDNSMDRGAWRATVLGVAKSQTQLSNQCT